jgi:type II secretory pathway pseudopilin PulG
MKKLFKIQKNRGMIHSMFTQGHPEYSRGMTYVEIIVVLGIFAIMSSIVIFNYGEFQARVDIKNLASDIALKIVEAQKSALSGKLSTQPFTSTSKPSYGVYFNLSTSTTFIYFADLNNANGYEAGAETLDPITITKGNYISNINKCSADPCDLANDQISSLSIAFKRPDSRAVFFSSSSPMPTFSGSDYIQITIKSPKTATAKIKIYLSGRIQIN